VGKPTLTYPLLCLITDPNVSDLVTRVEAALSAGVNMLQLRGHSLPAADLYRLALILRPLCHHYETIFLINDRIDVGLAAGADGFQLGRRSLPLAVARQLIGEDYLLGASVHSCEEALVAESSGADFLLVGTIFASHTHPDEPPSGIDLLHAIRGNTHRGSCRLNKVMMWLPGSAQGPHHPSPHLRPLRDSVCSRYLIPSTHVSQGADPPVGIGGEGRGEGALRRSWWDAYLCHFRSWSGLAHKGHRSACPLLAVGGITQANARQVMQAGADGIAVISAILGSDNVKQAVSELRMSINL
jgi:thiamine-phosphate diphosphorylase